MNASNHPGLALPKGRTRKQIKGRRDRAEAAVRRSCVDCGTALGKNPSPTSKRCRPCYYKAKAFKPYSGPCVVCGKACQPKTPSGRWSTRKIQNACSVRCAFRLHKPDQRPRECDECGKSYFPHKGLKKYCSKLCYFKKINRTGFAEAPCRQCGVMVRRRRHWIRGKTFCKQACQWAYSVGENSPGWRGGASLKRGKGWHRIAEGVRKRDGYACRRCGKTQTENGQKLSVDHVRPWRDRDSEEQANDPKNIVSLCRPCHAKKNSLERKYLQGDQLALQSYKVAVGLIRPGLNGQFDLLSEVPA